MIQYGRLMFGSNKKNLPFGICFNAIHTINKFKLFYDKSS
jgi:hypothetical protein